MAYELFPQHISFDLIKIFMDDLELIKDTIREMPRTWIPVAFSFQYEEMAALRDAMWSLNATNGAVEYRRQIVPTDDGWALFAFYVKDEDADAAAVENATESEIKLCLALAERVEANGYRVKNPTGKLSIQAARMCFKRATEVGKDEQSVFRLLDWTVNHDFWSSNIRSMPKFYKQYDVLREQANREHGERKAWAGKEVKQKTASVWDKA